ncbi:MAG: SDR family oxidoreductase [Thiotrichales bacterium]
MADTLIVGCGDIGLRLAELELRDGRTVRGLVRSPAGVAALTATGIIPEQRDLDDARQLADLDLRERDVYYFAPPPDHGTTDPRMVHFLACADGDNLPRKLVYISTTGVYGDCAGAWITEAQPVNPRTDRGKRRLAAETTLRAWSAATGVPVVVLRVPGIYGPGRLPERRLRQGLPVLIEAEAPYSNRIHADDLAEICRVAMLRAPAGELYNVADDNPTTMSHYFNCVADHLGIPRPPAVSLAEARERLTPAMLSFIEESRRVDNRKLRDALGIELRYPTLEAGLSGLIHKPE